MKHWLIILFLFCISSLSAQTTQGKEFWVTFGKIFWHTHTNIHFLTLQIRIVSNNIPTTGTIYFSHLNDSVAFSMGVYETFTYTLDNDQKQAAYNTVMGITNYSIRITSNEPVTVYALNFLNVGAQGDVTNILPVSALGKEYYQISYSSWGAPAILDAYAVIAIQNNTHLYHNGDTVATLDAGEVYYRTSDTDMTGAHITASNSVAFFALNQFTQIPIGSLSSMSHLMQQLAPVSTCGINFFVPSSHFTRDRVRVLALQNNTDIIQIGGIIQTDVYGAQDYLTDLQVGQFVELEISDTGCYIIANKPIVVCSYLSSWFPIISNAAQCWIPAIEQTIPRAQIAPFVSKHIFAYFIGHYAMVCTPTDTKDSTKVSVGGALPTTLFDGNWIENDTAKMSFYIMPLTNDTMVYTFTNPKGLIILNYASGHSATYYYLAGSAMRELDAAFYANDVHFQDLKDNPFCENEIIFRAEIENMGVDVDSIKWYIESTEYDPARDSLQWSSIFSIGEYEIKMEVYHNNDTVSKIGTLKIKNCELDTAFYANDVNLNLKDTTFCNKTVSFITYIEGLNTTQDSIKWYIDFGDEIGFVEHLPARNQKQWSRDFSTGNFPIKMWVRLENDIEIEVESILKMEILWIKIRNVRY